MTRLSQILAVEKGLKNDAKARETAAYHTVQRTGQDGPLAGISRRYTPRDDADTEQLPGETKLVQTNVKTVIAGIEDTLARLFDVTATKDVGNTHARADVVIGGQPLLTAVPVTYLLFLEKRLVELAAFIRKLPVLDPGTEWKWDNGVNAYVSAPVQTVRTKKIPRAFELSPATDRHPAQVQAFTEDVTVGTWTTVRYSGALEAAEVQRMTERVTALHEAVKTARAEANSTTISDRHDIGWAVLNYVFRGHQETVPVHDG